MPLDLNITTGEKIHISLKPAPGEARRSQGAMGQRPRTTVPGSVNAPSLVHFVGPAEFSVVSGDGKVEADADGLGAFLVSSDTPGLTVYLIKGKGRGDADVEDTVTMRVRDRNAGRADATRVLSADGVEPK